MAISRDLAIAAYQLFLGRDPESEAVIEQAMRALNREECIRNFIGSAESRAKNPGLFATSRAWVWAQPASDFILKVNLSDNAIAWPAIENQFEPAETMFVRSHIRDGHATVDVGANIGYFTMLLSAIVGKRGSVHSFEPLPHLFDALSESIVRNGFNNIVTAHNLALSSKAGTVSMAFANETDNWGGAQFDSSGNPRVGHTVLDVRAAVFDDFNFSRIDFMKIDVEGAEPLVIEGCAGTISRARPVILSEVHPEALAKVSNCTPADYLRLLGRLGYGAYRLTPQGGTGDKLPPDQVDSLMNVLFVPSEYPDAAGRLA